jgi:hypothetical protein
MLPDSPQRTLKEVAERLQCLELNFDDRNTLHKEMLERSRLFQKVFSAATNIRGLHMGFTSPASINFDSVFKDVWWTQLQYVGFVAWQFNSGDITRFLLRHRNSLKFIRLRGVLLEEGCQWLDVLKVLRRDLVSEHSRTRPSLKWVSLRRVGYSGQYQASIAAQEEDDDNDVSDSSDESDFGLSSESEGSLLDTPITEQGAAGEDEEDSDAEGSIYGNESDDSEVGEGINDLAIPDKQMVEHTAERRDSVPQCYCGDGYAWEDLRDDYGRNPPKNLWKWWQNWVVKQCPLGHDVGKE